jgi:hypothetical protein
MSSDLDFLKTDFCTGISLSSTVIIRFSFIIVIIDIFSCTYACLAGQYGK